MTAGTIFCDTGGSLALGFYRVAFELPDMAFKLLVENSLTRFQLILDLVFKGKIAITKVPNSFDTFIGV